MRRRKLAKVIPLHRNASSRQLVEIEGRLLSHDKPHPKKHKNAVERVKGGLVRVACDLCGERSGPIPNIIIDTLRRVGKQIGVLTDMCPNCMRIVRGVAEYMMLSKAKQRKVMQIIERLGQK